MNKLQLRATTLVIRHAILRWPHTRGSADPSPPEIRRRKYGCRWVGPADIPVCLGNLCQAVTPQGELALFFPDCVALAAPFVLFHLKRTGFSNCRVTVASDGLMLHGAR